MDPNAEQPGRDDIPPDVIAPVGYIVAVLPADVPLAAARSAVEAGGYAPSQVRAMSGEQYLAALAEAEGEGAGPVKKAVAAVRAHASEEERFAQEHAALAKAGAGFLVVEASRGEDAARVRRALDPVGVTLVREYGTLTITDEP